MIFEKNDIPCMHDFRFYNSVPVGIDFEVFDAGCSYRLTAKGWGGTPYGSGSVFVKKVHVGEYAAQFNKVCISASQKESGMTQKERASAFIELMDAPLISTFRGFDISIFSKDELIKILSVCVHRLQSLECTGVLSDISMKERL